MSNAALRKLVIDGATYLWGSSHQHLVVPGVGARGGPGCRELFTAYLDGKKRAPLRVFFPEGAGLGAGYPQRGVIYDYRPGGHSYNLNRPGVAAALIRAARARGWDPARARKPYLIADGFTFVREELSPALSGV